MGQKECRFREQRVVVTSNHQRYISDSRAINIGVPQGSVIGTLLFILYINDISTALGGEWIRIINYADDTNVLVLGTTLNDLFEKSERCLHESEKWFSSYELMLNAAKSNFVCFRTKQSQQIFPEKTNLLSWDVTLSSDAKFPGLHIDQHLSSMYVAD